MGKPPEILVDWLTGDSDLAKDYRENILNYNAALAFASRKASIDSLPNGQYCMRIHGQVYHKFGLLEPGPNQQPKYAQIYILDNKTALAHRMNIAYNIKCNEEIMEKLTDFLNVYNHYSLGFKTMAEVLKAEEQKAKEKGQTFNYDAIKMYICHQVNN